MQKDPELVALALEALKQAYAPYSSYRVGAALRCADGSVFVGCNVENASYGLTNCAERTAVFSAVAAGQRDFVRMAIATETTTTPVPCGACLQVLAEWGRDLQLFVVTPDRVREGTLYQYLPKRFVLKANPGAGPPPPLGDGEEGRETL